MYLSIPYFHHRALLPDAYLGQATLPLTLQEAKMDSPLVPPYTFLGFLVHTE